MMFKSGEKVFYPYHGAGEIQKVEEKEVLGEKRVYYVIRFPLTETTIMVPANNTTELGLRYIADPKEIKKCYEIISAKEADTDEDMLKSGTAKEVSLVIKNLHDRNQIKELSSTEKKLYNSALSMLISEVALSSGKNQDNVREEITKLLDRKKGSHSHH